MCTMDYVTHVRLTCGWERAKDVDAYFRGDEDGDDDDDDDVVTTRRGRDLGVFQDFADKSCQTPVSWWTLQAPPSVKEAEPRRALDRKRALDAGLSPPKPFFRPNIEGW